jgi:hypothetical protein
VVGNKKWIHWTTSLNIWQLHAHETSFLLMLERNRVWYFLDFATKQKQNDNGEEKKRFGFAIFFAFFYKIKNIYFDIFLEKD